MSLILAFVLALIIALAAYWKARPPDLFALRFAGTFLLIAFLSGVSVRYRTTRKPDFVLYRDVSPSMMADQKWEWADSTVSRIPDALAKVRKFFSDTIYVTEPDSPAGDYTDLSLPLKDSRGRYCVVVTDGLHNAPEDLYSLSLVRDKPVFFLIPPLVEQGIDLAIRSVEAPSVTHQGENADVSVRIKLSGGAGRIRLSVKEGKNVLIDTSWHAGPGDYAFRFSLSPITLGLHTYSIRLEPLEGEFDTLNNSRVIGIEVISSKSTGLILSSHPDPIIRLIRSLVSELKYADISVITRVAEQKWKFMGKTVRDTVPDLNNPDFLILVDPDKNIMRMVKDVPPERLIVIPGRLSLESGLFGKSSAGGGILPGPSWAEVGSSFQDWQSLPVYGLFTGGVPIKVYLQLGQKPAVFTDSRGSFVVALNKFWIIGLYRPELFTDVMGFAIERAARPQNILFAYPEQPIVFRGQPVRFRAEAYDGFGNPLNDLKVLLVRGKDTLRMAYSGPGSYISPPLKSPPGKQNVRVIFVRDTMTIGVKKTSVKVLDTPIELLGTGIDTTVASAVARNTGGEVFRSAEEFVNYAKDIKEVREHRIDLNRSILLLIISILLFSVEWWLRKNRGMA